MDDTRVRPVRVAIAEVQFGKALRQAGTTRRDELVTWKDGSESPAPGFAGTVSTLARFMLVAQDLFGPYDSAMLAEIVRIAWRGQDSVFYFPGLELY